jgi:hypothetical protein
VTDTVLLDKEHQFVKWLLERTAKYPREHRYGLAVHVNKNE